MTKQERRSFDITSKVSDKTFIRKCIFCFLFNAWEASNTCILIKYSFIEVEKYMLSILHRPCQGEKYLLECVFLILKYKERKTT